MNNVISLSFEGSPVRFNADGWIDAASAAKRFGKKPAAWLRSIETLEYLSALAEALFGKGVSETQLGELRSLGSRSKEAKALTLRLAKDSGLVITKNGRGGGTWLHPKLGVRFAQWLEVRFAVWCDLQIDSLLRGFPSAMGRFNHACKRLDDRQSRASASGRDLAEWKREKPGLIAEVERGRNQLQMILALDNPESHNLRAAS
ncbi:KilA-N domain-containing protein [Pseudomonas sp. WS 5414]|uniref:KilA-N domain-containing protein n=1 Tax=Pseudomonas sp. WS 5414 TaxID=2717478 RepID=UPI001473920A|nr:DNA-binding protein [Pseudomonas sp. WS 5414]